MPLLTKKMSSFQYKEITTYQHKMATRNYMENRVEEHTALRGAADAVAPLEDGLL